MPRHLINDVIKPWEELNALLVNPFAVEPGLSDITRLASSLSISIKHQVDFRKGSKRESKFRKEVEIASLENRMISDVADAAKHGKLRDPARYNRLNVASCFEYKPNRGYRFIRNSITILYENANEYDFMTTSLAATKYWMAYLGISLGRELIVSEGPEEFSPTAYLYYNPAYCTRAMAESW